jgi:SpoVK/Ycf46/Vps4 family AAA+-type ATPase
VIDEFDKILDTISEKPVSTNDAATAAMKAMSANLLSGIMGFGGVGTGGNMSETSNVIVVDSDSSSNDGNYNKSSDGDMNKDKGGSNGESFKKKKSGDSGGMLHGPANLMKTKSVINDADILTIMDGLVETSGRIIICTANDPSKIGEPFKRPGRLDEHIEFTKCTRKMIIQLLELFYSTTLSVEQKEKISNMENNLHLKYSPAEINKFCFNNIENIDAVISEILE